MRRSRAGVLIVLVIAVASVAGVQYATDGSPVTSDGGVEDTNVTTNKMSSGDSSSNADSERSWNLPESTGPEYPTDEQYVNNYVPGEPPKWIPESEYSKEDNMHVTSEVTRYPNATPTQKHLENSWELYNETYEAVKENGWFEYENTVEQGYVDHVLRDDLHYYNLSYLLDGESLNPNKPEILVYYNDPENKDKKILAGVMYENVKKEGEQVGGPLTVWHYHGLFPREKERANKSLSRETKFETVRDVFEEFYEEVPEGRMNRTAEMIHVWFVDHPDGPFGTGMSVPEENIQNPRKLSKEEFQKRILNSYLR